jgi:predicted ATP-grasp superfamily ATP-dependent carboligase
MVMNDELTPVVVLDLGYGGYGVVRSLVPYGIPVIGFCNQRRMPEYRTRLCEKKVCFDGDADLKDKLKETVEGLSGKPVLYVTTDHYVSFVIKNREFINEHFLIHLPSNDVLELLLDKTAFSDYAIENNILIPQTHHLFSPEDLDHIEKTLSLPFILKPFTRTEAWRKAKLAKAYYVTSLDELKERYATIHPIEPRLMVQEWVPGGDSNVHYCLVYFDEKNECLASFTGYKVRQWPVGTGTASSTAPLDNDYVTARSIEIMKLVKYSGFGSIEFKLHDLNGKHYLIEPTVGRVEQIGYVATANGVNLPLHAYNSLTGSAIREETPPVKNVLFIDEPADIASAMVHFRKKMMTLREYLRGLKRTKQYRYYNRTDLGVFMGLFVKALLFNFKR